MSTRRTDLVTGTETTGHQWDGIEELNNPLPRWWLWTFYGTVLFSLVYVILYPAWPLLNGATGGLLGWSTRQDVAQEIAAVDASQAEVRTALVETDLAALDRNDDLLAFATNAGAAVFRTNCSQCHGSGAAGAVGYPNLLDDDWLWGGMIEDIAYTVRHGIRNEDDPDARFSQMPGFGDILSEEEIATLVAHVQSLPDGADPVSGPGGALFEQNCTSCHGMDGRGDRSMGAPNLTDAIWLYGGSTDRLTRTITRGPYGVMPAWNARLSEAEIRAVAAYVHGLGGGEAQVGEGEGPAGDGAHSDPGAAPVGESASE